MHEQILVTLEQWLCYINDQYTILPYVAKFGLPRNSTHLPSWEVVWAEAGQHTVVLESGKNGQYTIVGLNPVSIISGKGNVAWITTTQGDNEVRKGAPLDLIKAWMAPYRAPHVVGLPKFVGGCVGYASYDIVRSIEHLPQLAKDDLDLPDYMFMQMNEVWIIDHKESALYCAVMMKYNDAHLDPGGVLELSVRIGESGPNVKDRVQKGIESLPNTLETHFKAARQQSLQMKKQWNTWWEACTCVKARQAIEHRRRLLAEYRPELESSPKMKTTFPKDDFIRAVHRIQQYISQGDVFQVNLSVRQMRAMHSTPEQLYEWLRLLNPSPYMGLLRSPNFQLVSCSPELLVRLEQREVVTRPIAGTRRRGRTPEEDEYMAAELRTNEKERAEHIMLVDLERNDIGRIAEYGTVQVKELMMIEYYSHVMHLVSEVKGTLVADKDAFDVFRATFPGGTITGAPKVRTMEIIEELEPVYRGPYTGSLGWIDYNGNMEFNIIIRTMTMKDSFGYIQAGAGIVVDSNPQHEYKEIMNKAGVLWKAVHLSERDIMMLGG